MQSSQITMPFIKEASPTDVTPDFPEGKYPILLADPPWRYDFPVSNSRKVENHYPTMTLDDIKTLEVPSADDAALFLWTTSPKMEQGFEVLEAWGFQYKAMAVWVKTGCMGMGIWMRQSAEYLLVASKGSMKAPKPTNRQENVIYANRAAHSQKPVEAYRIIEAMYPDLPKIELFSRNSRDGWDSWGLEAQG